MKSESGWQVSYRRAGSNTYADPRMRRSIMFQTLAQANTCSVKKKIKKVFGFCFCVRTRLVDAILARGGGFPPLTFEGHLTIRLHTHTESQEAAKVAKLGVSSR